MDKNKKKLGDRILSMFLAILLVVNLLPLTMHASGSDFEEDGISEDGGSNVLFASMSETRTVAAAKTGNGTVKLNGTEQDNLTVEQDAVVSIEIIPMDTAAGKTYISSLTINGEEQQVEKYSSYQNTEYTVGEDTAIGVVFSTEYTVSGEFGAGGSMLFDAQPLSGENHSKTVPAGTSVHVQVIPDEQYQIKSVTVNGVDETLVDTASYEKDVLADGEIVIKAEFERVYTLAVSYEGAEGAVNTGSSCQGGTIKVAEGADISVEAVPNPNYRVSKVVKNGEELLLGRANLDEKTANGYVYSDTDMTSMDQDYSYEITFASDYYEVSAAGIGNGKVGFHASESTGSIEVDHGGSAALVLTPEENYRVKSICKKTASTPAGTEIDMKHDAGYVENLDGTSVYTIENITEAMEIEVEFEEMETCSGNISSYLGLSAVSGEQKCSYTDGLGNDVYIFSKDSQVSITPVSPYDQISVKYSGKESYEPWAARELLSASREIESLRVRTGKGQNAANVDMGKKVIAVIDQEAPVLALKAEKAHKNDYYNRDFTVDIEASDPAGQEAASGIAKVEYKVICASALGDLETMQPSQAGILYEAGPDTQGIGAYNPADYASYQAVSVNADANNSDYVRLAVTVTDLSGNSTTETQDFKINTTVPKIKVTMEGESKAGAKEGYYSSRKATIAITDRTSSFDPDSILEKLEIEAKDLEGNDIAISKAAMLSEWETIEGAAADEATHQATLTFGTDANYEWSISYENKAGLGVDGKENDRAGVEAVGDHVWKFAVDTKAPIESTMESEKSLWGNIVDTLSFHKFFNYAISVTAVPKDDVSPVHDITYYKLEGDAALSVEQLEELYKNGKFTEEIVTVSSEEAFAVYARLMDDAGNVCYISTDGVIVDLTNPGVVVVPEAANKNGFHNSDVKVEICVNDKMQGQVFSGIQKVSYTILCDGKATKKDEALYIYDSSHPTETVNDAGKVTLDDKTGLPEAFQEVLIVNGSENNGDQVQVQVTVVDNAGNSFIGESNIFSINTVKPKCEVTFGNGKANKIENGYGWYGRERTVTAVITDRESTFDQEAAAEGLVITGTNGKGESVTLNHTKISWSTDAKDSSRHIAAIVFADDANYQWSMSYTNRAGLGFSWEEAKKNGESVSAFTVDKNQPKGTVTVGENIWDVLLQTLTFGWYNRYQMDVRATASDDTSPVTIQYYKTSNPIAMAKDELDRQTFMDYHDFSVTATEQFVVYLKIMDYAGNYIYINSDGGIVDQKASKITLEADKANENQVYNKNVNVAVTVQEETESYAGIQTIEYWVEADGRETQRQTLYSFDYTRDTGTNNNGGKLFITDWATGKEVKTTLQGDVPTQDQLKKEWKGTVGVDARKNNSSNVVVYVRTKDNAGNENTVKSEQLDIDITRPEITVSYDNNSDNGGNGYFPEERKATVEIRERTNHFNEKKALERIKVKAVDAKGKKVETGKMISSFRTTEGASPDDAVHRATITYREDANYTFSISYTDEAGNKNKGVDTGSSIAPYQFTIDKTGPVGTVSSKTAEGREDSWSKLVNRLTFGIWSKSGIELKADASDATSPVASLEYFKTNDSLAMTKAELEEVTGWKKFRSFSVKENQQFTVYIKITDKAGNVSYISTNGMIVDSKKPRVESIAPEVKISPKQPVNGIYNGNVNVDIEIQDPLKGGTYSGLKTVSYRVLNMGTETQSGVLYSFDKAAPVQSELRRKWSGSITVDSAQNNSNDVAIEVYAEDNALNSVTNTENIKIDITKPKITVSYDNNNPDSEKYYKDSRTATIVVNERNFDPKDIVVSIANTEGAIPSISEWTTGAGDGNLDNTPHTATVIYEADGDYTFDIAYTDLAGNPCDGENYAAGTANGTEFTIDKTLPSITVSYDNNDAADSKYFKESRTATITVEEHNFDVGRVRFTQTASLNGAEIAAPAPVWSDNGDTHTATISYDTDGDYTFDVAMADMAGNENSGVGYGSDTASQEFTVDTKIEKPVISGVENGKAYKGQIVPVIDFSDVNYADYSVELRRTRMGSINEDVKDRFIKNMNINAQGGSGSNNTFEMVRENDGIYTLKVQFSDKAGNEETETVTFTLNRFGSVYEYNGSLLELIQDGGAYVKSVDKDLVITEYNADKLVNGSLAIEVTRDGKPISDMDYAVSPEINNMVKPGDSGWYQYSYRIAAENFKEDGVYKLAVSSKDETGNTPENTPENTNYEKNAVLFRVDATPPEITSVTGLENGVVNGTEVEIGYSVYDTIGLKSVEVKVDGQTVGEKITDFGEDRNNYAGTFRLGESTHAQNVQLVVYDMAENCTDTDAKDFESAYAFHRQITVSTNFFVRWYANKPLFWGCIGGAVVMAGAVIAVFMFSRRRRKGKEL